MSYWKHLLAIVVSLCSVAHANDSKPLSLTKKDVNLVEHHGPVELEKVNVLQTLNVQGRLEAEESTFNSMNVIGEAELSEVVITGYARFVGNVEIEKGAFFSVVEIDGDQKKPTLLKRVSTPHALRITGPAVIKEAMLNTLTVHGKTELENVVATGVVTIKGSLEAEKVNFFDLLTIEALKAKLYKVVAKDIRIQAPEGEIPVLYLNQAVVTGDIVFENGQGEVIVDNADLLGQVRGGKVKKR